MSIGSYIIFAFLILSGIIILAVTLRNEKPFKNIFLSASNYAHLNPEDCWYCGDGRIPDVDGAKNAGMTPVLLDKNSQIPLEFRNDGGRGGYMTINNWNVLKEYFQKI